MKDGKIYIYDIIGNTEHKITKFYHIVEGDMISTHRFYKKKIKNIHKEEYDERGRKYALGIIEV